MIEQFLKAKHWQLFLLVFGLPFLIYCGWMIHFTGNIFNDYSYEYYDSIESVSEMFSGITTMILLMMIPWAIQYAWFWSMAIGLQSKLPDGMKMKVNMFKTFFIIPVVYFLLYMLFWVTIFGNIENLENLEYLDDIGDFNNVGLFVLGFLFFIGLSMFVLFCSFYQYWFIAKTIKSAQLQKEAEFSEFVGEFFLIWFYPIGVWILQPTVNKLVDPVPQPPEIKG